MIKKEDYLEHFDKYIKKCRSRYNIVVVYKLF